MDCLYFKRLRGFQRSAACKQVDSCVTLRDMGPRRLLSNQQLHVQCMQLLDAIKHKLRGSLDSNRLKGANIPMKAAHLSSSGVQITGHEPITGIQSSRLVALPSKHWNSTKWNRRGRRHIHRMAIKIRCAKKSPLSTRRPALD
jgi:hypothetical protein